MTDLSQKTLYSGAHRGAESEFGKQAEKWGLKEVNYSFEGHQMDRNRGIVTLSEEELAKGDISMEIVSKSLGRRYHHVEKIRKVIQSIFHMVNNGIHVFAIGWIQPDNTVKGGTGWAVELGKLFNRPISVFDQDKNAWFSWKDNSWIEDEPVITEDTFVGTGTRNLSDEGKAAIEKLFERSFS
jgi:hypothetical protein